eukprot:2207506-Alexandrium_andersonii.AAC.1
MSASLVGSEMCIRDRPRTLRKPSRRNWPSGQNRQSSSSSRQRMALSSRSQTSRGGAAAEARPRPCSGA